MRLGKKGATVKMLKAYSSLAAVKRLFLLIRLVVLSLSIILISYYLNLSRFS